MFCCGATKDRNAATNPSQSCARATSKPGFGGPVLPVEPGPGERHHRARRCGCRRHHVRDHRPVPGLAHGQHHRRGALDPDRLGPGREGLRAGRRQVAAGVRRVDGLDEQVLHVRAAVGEPPGDPVVARPSTTNGTAGSVAPITLRSGASRCARYHTPGAVRWRCGSFASSGAPVAVRLPATTHSFEPKRSGPGRAAPARRYVEREAAQRFQRGGVGHRVGRGRVPGRGRGAGPA